MLVVHAHVIWYVAAKSQTWVMSLVAGMDGSSSFTASGGGVMVRGRRLCTLDFLDAGGSIADAIPTQSGTKTLMIVLRMPALPQWRLRPSMCKGIFIA